MNEVKESENIFSKNNGDPLLAPVDEGIKLTDLEHKIQNSEIVVKICPFCHPDTNQSSNQWKLYINRDTGLYICHRCGKTGVWQNSKASHQQKLTSIELCKKLWSESVPLKEPDALIARKYLVSRDLVSNTSIASLRFHRSCPYFDDSKQVRNVPALICKITDVKGNLTGVQRIYLTDSGSGKAAVPDPKKALGTIKGNAVHLGDPIDSLAVTEGVETGLAVSLATRIPVWAAVSASGMESIVVPDTVTKIYIWADLDKSGRGERAAEVLTERLKSLGKSVYTLLPEGPLGSEQKGIDWLDVFIRNRKLLTEALARVETIPKNEPEQQIILDHVKWPAKISDDAYFGIAGDIVKLIEPHTEADPTALLVQILIAFGNVIGRSSHYLVESTKHHMNLFVVLVGDTAKGRKGTSLDRILSMFREIAPEWCQHNVISGLSTGEGLIHHVRDPVEKKTKKDNDDTDEMKDSGVVDKRLLVIEPEYSSVLRITSREGNTLSPVTREAWDRGDLRTLTKNSPERATGAHISIIGHITSHELRRYLTETEALNGYGNRFLWVCVRRSKLLPFGGKLNEEDLKPYREQLSKAIRFGENLSEIKFAPETMPLWSELYTRLADAKPGLYGSMTARAEAQVIRLASLYAVMNESAYILPQHLRAALAIWEFCDDSCRYIFGHSLGDIVADRILDALKTSSKGLSRTEIRELFHGKQSAARIEQGLGMLTQYGLARSSKESTSGRPVEWWFAVHKSGSAKRVERVLSPDV